MKFNVKLLSLLFVFSLLLFSMPSPAQDPVPVRWQDLSEAKKTEILANFRNYQALPPEARAKVDAQFNAYATLDPSEKKRVQENYSEFSQLSDKDQARLLESYERFQRLPLSIQRQIEADARAGKKKPPSRRRDADDLPMNAP